MLVYNVGLDLLRAMTMKNAAFWDVAKYGFNINRSFGGTCRIQFEDRRNNASKESVRPMLTD
jgi:hypothetical protein